MASRLESRSTEAIEWGNGACARRHNARATGPSNGPWLVVASGFGTDQSAWDTLRPTLLILSLRDIAVPSGVGEYLAANIAGSRLAWIDNDGHLPHITATDAVRDALESWR